MAHEPKICCNSTSWEGYKPPNIYHLSHNFWKALCTKGKEHGRDVLNPSHISPIISPVWLMQPLAALSPDVLLLHILLVQLLNTSHLIVVEQILNEGYYPFFAAIPGKTCCLTMTQIFPSIGTNWLYLGDPPNCANISKR